MFWRKKKTTEREYKIEDAGEDFFPAGCRFSVRMRLKGSKEKEYWHFLDFMRTYEEAIKRIDRDVERRQRHPYC